MEITQYDQDGPDEEARNLTWHKNQIAIANAIDHLMRKNERVPTQIEIAERTGLSRKTIYVHLKIFKATQKMADDLEQVELMSGKVFARLVQSAADGNMMAMRLWLMVTGAIGKKPNVYKPGDKNSDQLR